MARRRRRASAKRGPGAPRRPDAAGRAPDRGTATAAPRSSRAERSPRAARRLRPERAAQAPPQARARATPSPVSQPTWPVHAAAAMLVFSAAAALLFALRELSYHTLVARDALLHGGTAICAGVAVGLWIPRQFILRRLSRSQAATAGPDAAAGAPHDANPAAPDRTLISALFVAAGGSLVLLGVLSTAMETSRALLAGRFMFAAWLTRSMLEVPVIVALALASCIATVAMVALHGLHRAAGIPRARIGRLWAVIVCAAMAGALAAGRIDGDFGLLAIALLPVLVAGAVAALQRRGERAQPVPSPHTPASYVAFDLLLTVTVAAAAAAYACVSAVSRVPMRPIAPDVLLAVATAAALAGVWAGQWLGRRAPGYRPALVAALALVGVAWALPLHAAPFGDLLTLGTVTATAVTCIVLATRRVSAACESAQYALSVVGACIAAGCAVAFISAPLWISALSRGHVGALLSLGVMAVVGWLLMLDVRMSARVRGGGLIAVGLWLAVAPLAASRADAEFAGRASAAPGDREIAGAAPGPNDRAIRAGRTLLAACGLHIAAIGDLGVPTPGDVEWVDGWQADLAPVGPDLAIIDRPLALVTGNASPAARRRLLTRCAGILHRHGRVAIEDPDEAWGRHALAELVAANPRAESSAYLLRASTGEGDYTALLLGSDVPAWIAEARRRADVPAGLYRVESPEALRDLLSSH